MANYLFNDLPYSSYISIVKNPIISPTIRLTMLYNDESYKEDITNYVMLENGSLSINYQQGQRRSLNFTLNNTDGRFLPSVNSLWLNSKFKLELGLVFNNGNDIVYNSAGIFVISNPDAIRNQGEKNINVQCVDKFALLDGTLGGTLDSIYEIPSGSNVKVAIQGLISQDNGNNHPIDVKPMVFDNLYKDETTQYTISKSGGSSIGEIIIDLANMLGCDVWYGIEGNLIIRSGVQDINKLNQPTLWEYSDLDSEYLNNGTSYNFDRVKNVIVVVGSNVNGDNIYIGKATNINPQSPTRVGLIGTKLEYIEDANIFNDSLAQQRADYELNKLAIMSNTISLQSTYMIHLDVNNCISITDSYYGYFQSRFVIQSVDIPLGANSTISISCTNVNNLPYYTESA